MGKERNRSGREGGVGGVGGVGGGGRMLIRLVTANRLGVTDTVPVLHIVVFLPLRMQITRSVFHCFSAK